MSQRNDTERNVIPGAAVYQSFIITTDFSLAFLPFFALPAFYPFNPVRSYNLHLNLNSLALNNFFKAVMLLNI